MTGNCASNTAPRCEELGRPSRQFTFWPIGPGTLRGMTDEPFIVPGAPDPDDVPAADLGEGAPRRSPGYGEGVEPDVFPDEEPGGDTLDDELRDRPTPPFRTPHPGHSS